MYFSLPHHPLLSPTPSEPLLLPLKCPSFFYVFSKKYTLQFVILRKPIKHHNVLIIGAFPQAE